jgi:carbonic anhydrase
MSTAEILLLIALTGMIFLYARKNKRDLFHKLKQNNIISGSILTEAQQKALHPDTILSILKEGNQKFADGAITVRNNSERIRHSSLGQHPLAVVLSCLDSRVPVEDVFQQGIGDIFVVRVAGNIVNEDILGSLEYACKVSGSKLILVLGHDYCGAIKSAVDNVKMGNITSLLAKISPAVAASSDFEGQKNSSNPDYLHHVCTENVKLSVQNIKMYSPILNEMDAQGEIKIVGAVYDMETGIVHFN